MVSKESLVNCDGLLMTKTSNITRFREATNYKPKDDDIFVATYHKSGTTWMSYIVHEIINNGIEPPYVHEMMMNYGVEIEKFGIPKVKNTDDGVKSHYKTHLPFNMVPFNENAKYIYVVRNPWDICLSYWNWTRELPQFNEIDGTFDEFFNQFISGYIESGSYFDHTVSWLNACQKHNNIFLVYFEEMKSNPTQTILNVAKFLNEKYYQQISEDENLLKKILEYTSFEYMKQLPCIFPKSKDVARKTGIYNVGKNLSLVDTGDYVQVNFFKFGKFGHTKDVYTDEQKIVMRDKINELRTKFPHLVNIWRQFNIDC